MQVTFKNVGMIEEAEIELNGLTVIAGENDTGKSTIGKLLFSIIKTFDWFDIDTDSTLEKNIKSKINDYHSSFLAKIAEADKAVLSLVETFFKELEEDFMGLAKSYETDADSGGKKTHILGKIDSVSSTLNQTSGIEEKLGNIFDEIVDIIKKEKSKKDISKISFLRYLKSVFGMDITNKFSGDKKYFITGQDDQNIVFELSGSDNSVEVRLKDKLYFDDATFIESPIPLDLAEAIRLSKTINEVDADFHKRIALVDRGYVPEYMRNFIFKVTEQRITGLEPPQIINDIKDIINGDFYYDRIEKDFIFKKENEYFKTLSIAAGIKYLGVIGLLVQNGFVNKKSLLIIDEPETNMHPKWQIRFAKALVQLVEDGNHILVTSHSPYFIEALKLYSDKSSFGQDKTNFYFSQKMRNGITSRINNVSHDISPIFEILSEPYEELEMLQLKDI